MNAEISQEDAQQQSCQPILAHARSHTHLYDVRIILLIVLRTGTVLGRRTILGWRPILRRGVILGWRIIPAAIFRILIRVVALHNTLLLTIVTVVTLDNVT